MRNRLFLFAFLTSLVAPGCSDAEVKGVGPGGGSDVGDASGDVIADTATIDSGADLDGAAVPDTGEAPPDVALSDGDAAPGDTGVDTGPEDTGVVTDVGPVDASPVDVVTDVQDTGDDTLDIQAPDIPEVQEDVEDPGLCEVDEDCILLTPKSCCPAEPDPCGGAPEAGTEQEQGEILGWIAQNCDPNETCEEFPAPACDACFLVVTYKAICDFEAKKCAVLEVPNCNTLCEAFAQPAEQKCPLVSHPDLVTADSVDDCGGCGP